MIGHGLKSYTYFCDVVGVGVGVGSGVGIGVGSGVGVGVGSGVGVGVGSGVGVGVGSSVGVGPVVFPACAAVNASRSTPRSFPFEPLPLNWLVLESRPSESNPISESALG